MIGALSQYGKLGILCIGATTEITIELYKKTVEVLSREKQVERYDEVNDYNTPAVINVRPAEPLLAL